MFAAGIAAKLVDDPEVRGMAVDMEWCVEKGQFYLVQARTIRA